MKKKILFIAPNYFGIEKKIKKYLYSIDYEVFYINDLDNSYFGWLIQKNKLLKKIIRRQKRNKIEKIIAKNNIDTLLVIKGSCLNSEDWEKIFTNTNIPYKVMYQWDSINNYDYTNFISLFDKVYTFDYKDSIKYKILYLPLFWEKHEREIIKREEDIDLLFVGIWHSDRISILNKINKLARKKGLNTYIKLYYPYISYLWLKYIRRKHIDSSFWIFKKISPSEMESLYDRAKCIIDINHPLQTGLTKRTIEAIGSGKKLLTTNNYIIQEDFYNDSNIKIIERDNIEIDFSFINSHNKYSNIEKYELSNWINILLSNDCKNSES